jgi:predicted transcriptional regulator of viral defense system
MTEMASTLHETREADAALLEALEAEGSRTFTLADARRIDPTLVAADLRRLVRAGWLSAVSRGVYTIMGRPLPMSDARLRLATAPYTDEPHYVSWAAALSFHGMTEKDPLRVGVALRRRHRERRVGPMRVEPVLLSPKKFYGFRTVRDQDSTIKVASPEKAILDSVDRPVLAGGLSEAVKAIGASDSYDPRKLVRLAKRYPSEATVSRLGYLMSVVGVPGAAELQGLVDRKRSLIPLDRAGDEAAEGVADPVWRVTDTVGPDRIRRWASL